MCCIKLPKHPDCKWWTFWFHIHCYSLTLTLIALFFTCRLIFDDLEKKQFILLSIHSVMASTLFIAVIGNRFRRPKLYWPFFVVFHLGLISNIGVEVFEFYTSPHPSSQRMQLSTMSPENQTAIRRPNGDPSPFERMHEEALYALIFLVLLLQLYYTVVMVSSFRFLQNSSAHRISPQQAEPPAGQLGSQPQVEIQIERAEPPKASEGKWERRFRIVMQLVGCIIRFVPKR